MANAELYILIKARNKAKAEFDSLNKQVNQLKGSGSSGLSGLNAKIGEFGNKFQSATGVSLGFATAAGAAGMAVSGIIKFLKSAVDESVKYATEVDNMARLLGLTTEETSKLIQASDDLFISQETLTSGLQAATRKGIDVSIDGLKKLADEYNALPKGVTRSKFVLDTFGRSGAEMGKLMEQGADGVQKAMDAIDDSLIVTEKSKYDIMNYKRSVDNLNDSWMGFTQNVGRKVIPQLDLLLRMLTPGTDNVEAFRKKVNDLNEQLLHLTKYGGMAGLTQEEVAAQAAALRNEIDKLTTEFYENQDAIEDETRSMYGLKNVVIPVTAYMSELTTQMLFNQAAAGLDADAALVLAESMGLVDEKTKYALDQLGWMRQKLDDGQISLEEYTALVNKLNDAMNRVRSREVKITVTGEITSSAREAAAFAGSKDLASRGNVSATARAGGGPAGGLTWVGEQGPELVNLPQGSHVYTAAQSARMGGGAVVNFYYAPALSLSDRTEAETKLIPIIRKALARA